MRFKKHHELEMTHPKYGDAKIEKVFKVNGVFWVTARVNDSLVVETPKSEWKLKDKSK